MYTKLVREIIKRHSIKYHCYANDTQVYLTLKPCDKWDDISFSTEAFIEHIGIWMNSNMLKLNKDKIKLIVFSSKQHERNAENLCFKLGSSHKR